MSELPAPRDTLELLGHQAAEAAFLDAWNGGRLAHAWLITGPKGIGKATFAHRIARFVLSGGGDGGGLFGLAPASLDTDPESLICRLARSGGHPDLRVVERGWTDDKKAKRRGEIVVADVREAGEFLSLTPSMGGWRVVVIDAVDEMNVNSANAILKVLEEPPRNALLLLVSHSLGGVMPTIRSRCRRLNLPPLADAVVDQLLTTHHPELTPPDRAVLVQLAAGSIGRALDLASEGGIGLMQELDALLSSMPRLDTAKLHAFAERVASARGGDSDHSWRVVTTMLERRLAERIKGEAVVPGRGAALESWLGVWEKVRVLFAGVESVNLDRKQALMSVMLMAERAAKA